METAVQRLPQQKESTNPNKRRLSVGFSLKDGRPSKENEPPTDLETNDDEAERRERRKSRSFSDLESPPPNAVGKKRMSLNPSSSNASNTVSPPANAITNNNNDSSSKRKSLGGNVLQKAATLEESRKLMTDRKKMLSNAQLTELYSACIQLCSENKINQKNTWDLNLIDYIDDVIEAQKEEQVGGGDVRITNFQAASATLDASVKIWSYRVDSVHTEAYKVLGGLSRTERKEDDQGQTEQQTELNEKTNENQETRAETKSKRHVGGVTTLESNLDNISLKKFDLAFDVDPLFKKTSATFDEGGARGLLLNHLNVYNDCDIIFDSRDAVEEPQKKNPNADCNITLLQNKLLVITDDVSQLEICPTFANFRFGKPQESDDTDDIILNTDFDIEAFSDEDVPKDTEANNNNPPPMHEDDMGMGMQFPMPNDDIDDIQQKEQNLIEEIQNQDDDDLAEDNDKTDTLFQLAADNNEFGFFDPKVLENWAGPDHWKFKPKNKAETSEQGAAAPKKKPGKKKEPFFFNFDEYEDIDPEEAFQPPGRAATTLSAAVLKRAATVTNMLPPDVHYDVKELTTLFNKPRWRISLTKRKRLDGANMHQADPADENGFFVGFRQENDGFANMDAPIMGPAADFEDGPVGNDFESDNDDFYIEAPAISEQELVAEPRKVEQIKINYAKQAKVVDIKGLKDTIWQEIQSDKVETDTKGRQKFSSLLEDLPSNLSEDALENVSVPFCFICLLHLANEKGLNVEQYHKSDLTELLISRGKS